MTRSVARQLNYLFHTPFHLAPPPPLGGVTVGILLSRSVRKKTRIVGLSDCEKTLRICITVYTQYRGVTDGQADILRRYSPRYAYALRGKKP